MAKRAVSVSDRLAALPYTWIKNSDTGVRCRRPNCQFKQKATYHKCVKVLDGTKYYGWFCFECNQPSPFTQENGYSDKKPSSLEVK